MLNNDINTSLFLKCFKSPVRKVKPTLANTSYMLPIKHKDVITVGSSICVFKIERGHICCHT